MAHTEFDSFYYRDPESEARVMEQYRQELVNFKPVQNKPEDVFREIRKLNHQRYNMGEGFEVMASVKDERRVARCVCEGNWRLLHEKYCYLFGRKCYKDGKEFVFIGLMSGEDDYYFAVYSAETGKTEFLSCVGCITESWGYLFEPSELSQATTKGKHDEESEGEGEQPCG